MAVPPVSIDDFALATVATRPDEAGGPPPQVLRATGQPRARRRSGPRERASSPSGRGRRAGRAGVPRRSGHRWRCRRTGMWCEGEVIRREVLNDERAWTEMPVIVVRDEEELVTIDIAGARRCAFPWQVADGERSPSPARQGALARPRRPVAPAAGRELRRESASPPSPTPGAPGGTTGGQAGGPTRPGRHRSSPNPTAARSRSCCPEARRRPDAG